MEPERLERLKSALAERYRIERELGAGGMATVYLAEDLKHRRRVAVKVLRPELAAALGAERFLREIETAARLSHPHILPLHDSGEAAGLVYYVMPYVEGESLREKLRRERQLSIGDALHITQGVASALDYAHRHNIVHRDIKPENILLHEGEAMVVDFGIALAMTVAGGERLTETGLCVGTPEYMSPEQATGDRQLGARSDIYSLGCVLYEMLAGEPPYTGATGQAVLSKRLAEPVPRLSVVRDSVPLEVERAVTKALARGAVDRYATARELTDAVQTAIRRSTPADRTRAVEKIDLPLLSRYRRTLAVAIVGGLVLGGLGWWITSSGQPDIERLAVLPVTNLTGDPEEEYFVQGMHDALITELGQISGLTVISRTSAMLYKDTEKPIPQIARELSVHAVVEVSSFRAGDTVRINAKLIAADPERQLWTSTYRAELRNVLDLHSQVARAIAGEIEVELTPGEQTRLATSRAIHPDAHDAYLRGLFHLNEGTEASFVRAIEFFNQAITIDSGYARAYAKLAETYALHASFQTLAPDEVFPRAKAAAATALRLDESLAESHAAMGVITLYYEWDWAGAEAELRRAIALNPNYALARQFYSWYLNGIGQMDEAVAEFERMIELDPLNLFAHGDFGLILHLSGFHERAVDQLLRTLEFDPDFDYAHWWLGLAYVELGRNAEGLAHLRRADTLSNGSPKILGALGYALAVAGERREARETLARLLAMADSGWAPPYDIAMVYTGLREFDAAFEWLDRAFETRDGWLTWVNAQPEFEQLRSDPRYRALLRRMSYPGL